MRQFLYICAVMFTLWFISCTDATKPPEAEPPLVKDTLTLSETALGFAREGATKTVKITSIGKWTAVSSASEWCVLSEQEGQGDATISITAKALISDASQRTTTVTVMGMGGVSRKIKITQQGLDVKLSITSNIAVSSTTLVTILPENIFAMQISTNAPYTVEVNADASQWLEVVDYSPDNQTYENRKVDQLFRAKENTTGAKREGSVIFTYKEMGGIKEHQVKMTVQQNGPSDRETLMELYEALGKPEEMTNWGSLLPINTWDGIKTVDTDMVGKLRISGRGNVKTLKLNGNRKAWEALAKLTKLYDLVISSSDLIQVPEEINNITNLTDLYISDAPITTGKNIDKLTGIKSLTFEACQLKAFPKEVCALTQLVSLRMDGYRCLPNNKMEGELPSEISNMVNLAELIINNQNLSGEIPASLGTMTKLLDLWIFNNQFSGEIPQAVLDCPMFNRWHDDPDFKEYGFCNQIGIGFSNCPKEHNKK